MGGERGLGGGHLCLGEGEPSLAGRWSPSVPFLLLSIKHCIVVLTSLGSFCVYSSLSISDGSYLSVLCNGCVLLHNSCFTMAVYSSIVCIGSKYQLNLSSFLAI